MKNVGEVIFILFVAVAVVLLVLIGATWAINYILAVFGSYEFTVFHTAVFITLLGLLGNVVLPKK